VPTLKNQKDLKQINDTPQGLREKKKKEQVDRKLVEGKK
jgi:hypothetical protein